MPRAHRTHVPGQVWHLTHRCHRRQFLLKFVRDRRLWRQWLFEACKRYGLCVLDYTATSNHVHLLVRDRGRDEIATSMHLIEGAIAQTYNRRKRRSGAFWGDQYHATAVETGEHLARCLVYVDLNMVRAGAVAHPGDWEIGGYHEIQRAPQRYRIVDRDALADALDVALPDLANIHREWVETALNTERVQREPRWSECLAVGSRAYVERFRRELGGHGRFRSIEEEGGTHVLRESGQTYNHGSEGKITALTWKPVLDRAE
jgi:putative transposase